MLIELTTQIESLSKICKTNNAAFNASCNDALSEIINTCQLQPDFENLRLQLSEQQEGSYNRLHEEFLPMLQTVAVEMEVLRALVSQPCTSDLIDELRLIHEAVKTKSSTPNSLNDTTPNLAEEITASSSANQPITSSPINLSAGWRWLGNKLHWKPQHEWEKHDRESKLTNHKHSSKSRRRGTRRNYNNNNVNNRNNNNNNNNNNRGYQQRSQNTTHHIPAFNINSPGRSTYPSDKELLAAAKVAFMGNKHRRPDPRPILFQQGETLNPYSPCSPAAPPICYHCNPPGTTTYTNVGLNTSRAIPLSQRFPATRQPPM